LCESGPDDAPSFDGRHRAAAVAGIAAWRIAKWSVRAWAAATSSHYLVLDYTIDGSTLAYLVGVCVLSAFLFSLAPIAKVLQSRMLRDFKGDVRGATHCLRAKRLGSVLVGGQMALAMVLLAGAGVLLHSLLNIVRLSPQRFQSASLEADL
jgi:hypothetical protein